MRKNRINAYNELNKAIARLGDLKGCITSEEEFSAEAFGNVASMVSVILHNALEEYSKVSRPQEEIKKDIIDLLRKFSFETYDLIINWDSAYEIHEDADDVFSSPSDMFADCDIDDINRLMGNEKFYYKDGYVVFADEEEITNIILDDNDTLDDFINYLVESRDDDEGDLNELLAEYENAEE